MDWQEIALIIALIALIVAGGFIKRLTTAVKSLVDSFDAAIQDEKITKQEWADILLKAKNLLAVVAELAKLVALKRRQ